MSIQEKGSHSLNIQRGGGGHSLNIQEKAVHSLDMHTTKNWGVYSLNIHKKGIVQLEHARIWNRITASILKQVSKHKKVQKNAYLLCHGHTICKIIFQELCESRGGRPGLSVLTSLLVSVDVQDSIEPCFRHWSQLVPNMSTDIWGH